MKKAIIGTKLGMTQIFLPDGRVAPVTVVQAGPCTVMQKKTVERDGYNAIQVGFAQIPENRVKKLVNKPQAGHFAKAGEKPTRYLREMRLEDDSAYDVGAVITADVFAQGEYVDVSGTSKGKGFTGATLRWNHGRGPMAHGSKYHRGVGSMSAGTDPGRVFKNKKMAGHWGHEHTTVQKLEVIRVDADRNLIFIKGALPGPKGGLLFIRNSVKA